jgi:RND family efflux transporter MFP subunit
VRSPIAGRIERKHVSAGQFVREGDRVATIVDARRLRLRFAVGEAESVHLRPGQAVAFEVRAFPGRPFAAGVVHVDAIADARTRMVECLAEVENPDPALRPGFYAVVHATVARPSKALVLPEVAVLPTERGFVAYAVVDGKASERRLVLGMHTRDGMIEVVSGLSEGEVVAVQGAASLEDGVAVKVVAADGTEAAPAAPGAAAAPGGGE